MEPSTVNTNPAPSQPTPEQLLGALEQPIDRVRVPLLYRAGLLLVAVTMVLLPILYLALIAGIGLLVIRYSVDGLPADDGSTWLGNFKYLIWVAPIVVWCAATLNIMIKPFLEQAPKRPDDLELKPGQQPLLFEFIKRLTTAIGAPMPSQIMIDCEVNASARFRRGMRSFWGNDFQLTIGMPLVAGLTLSQLAGVLSHEFAHFAQGGAMRLIFVILGINSWFERVINEHDELDLRLRDMTRESDYRGIQLVITVSRGPVWVSGRIFKVLMSAGKLISCFLLWQMEYDADRYEVRIAGSDTFPTTVLRLAELLHGWQLAQEVLEEAWKDRLLGDMPALIAHLAARLPKAAAEEIHQAIHQKSASLFAAHPADRDRIARARRDNQPGSFRFDQPAKLLFENLPELSRRVTLHRYQKLLGLEVGPQQLLSTADLAAHWDVALGSAKAIDELFGGGVWAMWSIPIRANATEPPADPAQELAELRAARSAMIEGAPVAEATIRSLFDATLRIDTVSRAEALLDAGYGFDPAEYDLPSADTSEIERARARATETRTKALAAMKPYDELGGRRLTSALRSLHISAISARLSQADDWRQECRRLVPALGCLGRISDEWLELRRDEETYSLLMNALEQTKGKERTQIAFAQMLKRAEASHRSLESIRRKLSGAPYPFAHGEGVADLAVGLFKEFPAAQDPFATVITVKQTLPTLARLFYRSLGRLAIITLAVEEAAGLKRDPQNVDPGVIVAEAQTDPTPKLRSPEAGM